MDYNKTSDIDNILKLLDGFAQSDTSRMKLEVSEEIAQGENVRKYHHGRCDIGSPWAKGTPFDLCD